MFLSNDLPLFVWLLQFRLCSVLQPRCEGQLPRGPPAACPPLRCSRSSRRAGRGSKTKRISRKKGRGKRRSGRTRQRWAAGGTGRLHPFPVVTPVFLLSCSAQIRRLQGRCEQQERQLRRLREELRKTSLGFEAFIITTQHYCLKVPGLNIIIRFHQPDAGQPPHPRSVCVKAAPDELFLQGQAHAVFKSSSVNERRVVQLYEVFQSSVGHFDTGFQFPLPL